MPQFPLANALGILSLSLGLLCPPAASPRNRMPPFGRRP